MSIYNLSISMSPRLIASAASTRRIVSSSKCATRSLSRRRSIVRSCSSRTTESRSSLDTSLGSSTCVGSFAFLIWEVTAATMVVGLYRLPMSFCKIRTGRVPPCSDPITGLRLAKKMSPLRISTRVGLRLTHKLGPVGQRRFVLPGEGQVELGHGPVALCHRSLESLATEAPPSEREILFPSFRLLSVLFLERTSRLRNTSRAVVRVHAITPFAALAGQCCQNSPRCVTLFL